MTRPDTDPLDIRERGAADTASDRRLFMQLQAFTQCLETGPAVEAVRDAGLDAVVYEDLNDPRGLAVVLISEDPADFADRGRALYTTAPFVGYQPRPELTMIGRSYSLGYERDLDETLIHRPRRHALHPDWPWAVWYPLRRSGAFMQLPRDQQMDILKEHGTIGMSFGRADLAHDIRLACHGLDANDNDFVVGLVGRQLTPLSKTVEAMRKTTQTAQYLERLGPFFVGRALYKSPLDTHSA